MAKFDILYSDMSTYRFEHDGLIKTNKLRTCCVCEDHTNYIHLDHAAPVCSEECLKKLDDQYGKKGERVKRSEKSFLEWQPGYDDWKFHSCHWTIGEKLFGAHPDNKGYKFCPHCGVEMTEPVMGTMYKGD